MSENILIVDDEPSNRRILEQVLARAGYSVETADDGAEALEQLDAFRPDLIILDYMMPDLSGMDVLRELRKREDDTPVIMITAYGTVERAVEAMQEGAYDFITRPFKPDHIDSCRAKSAGATEAEARCRGSLGGGGRALSFDCRRKCQDEAGRRLGPKNSRQQCDCFAPR